MNIVPTSAFFRVRQVEPRAATMRALNGYSRILRRRFRHESQQRTHHLRLRVPAQQYYNALVELAESPCAVVGQPRLSDYSTVYPRISVYKTCYPIPGGGKECIETPLGGSIRAFKPKYITSFDAAGCPLG